MKLRKTNNSPTFDLTSLGELYHDYAFFGAKSTQLGAHFKQNQEAKAPRITAYIAHAIAELTDTKHDISFMELFCADAYYAMVASRLGAAKCYGFDNDKDGFTDSTMKIARSLGINNLEIILDDANNLSTHGKFDIVANVGGLYHVENPEEILLKSYDMAREYLIVQSVVSLASHSKTHFESPAPGWTWGSRYSKESFSQMIKKHKFNVVYEHFNELRGNMRPEDRGSVYYLIKK